jgi:hypothetical protein
LPGWGAKSAAAVLARYGHYEDIPLNASLDVGIPAARVARLLAVLKENLELVMLFRDLATLRLNAPIAATPEDLRWTGPTPGFAAACEELEVPELVARAARKAPA